MVSLEKNVLHNVSTLVKVATMSMAYVTEAAIQAGKGTFVEIVIIVLHNIYTSYVFCSILFHSNTILYSLLHNNRVLQYILVFRLYKSYVRRKL